MELAGAFGETDKKGAETHRFVLEQALSRVAFSLLCYFVRIKEEFWIKEKILRSKVIFY